MVFLIETIKLGLTNLRLHILRSILTALGIIFGVAAVITMVSIGAGSTREALRQIERLGAKNIIVRSQKPAESNQQQGAQQRSFVSRYGVTRDDLNVVRSFFSDADAIVPLKSVGGQVLRDDRKQTSQAFGTTPEFREVSNIVVARGRYLTQSDLDGQEMVAVIGSEVAKQLFPFDDPLNNTFRIDDKAVSVIGILAPVGLSGGAGAALVGRDLNLDVHIPITTAQTVFGDTVVKRQSGSFSAEEVQISEVYIQVKTREEVLVQAENLKRIMDVRHPKMTDISMVVPYELLENARKTALTGQWISGMIAGISLLVGGIGIMNIMLATVTERTREIGIRRALGATRKHIVWQFMVETSVLTALGGLVGVALGIGLSVILQWIVPLLPRAPFIGKFVPVDTSLPTEVTLWSILVAFIVADL
jgi:putative ABC transport system permease protein